MKDKEHKSLKEKKVDISEYMLYNIYKEEDVKQAVKEFKETEGKNEI